MIDGKMKPVNDELTCLNDKSPLSRAFVVLQARKQSSSFLYLICIFASDFRRRSIDKGNQAADFSSVSSVTGKDAGQNLLFAAQLAVKDHKEDNGVKQRQPAMH